MSDSTYLPQNLSRTSEMELYMLPGIRFETDAVNIADLVITRLELIEWYLIEKGQFTDDLEGRMMTDPPYFCVFTSEDAYEKSTPATKYRSEVRSHSIIQLTRAIRLLRESSLYTPHDFIHYSRRGTLNTRAPGRFGRRAYEIPSNDLIDGREVQVIERLYYRLRLFDATRSHVGIAYALHYFDLSHDSAALSSFDPFLFLLSAAETLGGEHIDLLSKVRWTDSNVAEFCSRFRSVRNVVAHGKISPSKQDLLSLREVVRVMLREAIAQMLLEPMSQDATERKLMERLLTEDNLRVERLAGLSADYKTVNGKGE